MNRFSSPAAQWIFRFGLLLIAPAFAYLLLRGFFGASFAGCIPYWNDELVYWLGMSLYKSVGFAGGHCSVNEAVAPLAWSHFGSHGAAFAVFYGTLGKWFGFSPHSIFLFNGIFFTSALALWVCVIRPSGQALIWQGILLLTFWPLHLYFITSMQELMHYAVALVAATLTVIALRSKLSGGIVCAIVLAISILAISSIRITWAFYLIPFFLFAIARSGKLNLWFAAGVVFAVVVAAAYIRIISAETCSPYPGFITALGEQIQAHAYGKAFSVLGTHVGHNVNKWFSPKRANGIIFLYRYLVLAVMIINAVVVFRCYRKKDTTQKNVCTVHLISFFNLFFVVVILITLYDIADWRDTRVIAPHLFLSLLLLLQSDGIRWARYLLIINLLCAPFFFTIYKKLTKPRLEVNLEKVETFRKQMAPFIQYDPTSSSGWENTVLVSWDNYTYLMMGLPDGIGACLSPNRPDSPLLKSKSKYLLLNAKEYARISPYNPMTKITDTMLGPLYRNDGFDGNKSGKAEGTDQESRPDDQNVKN